MGFGLERPDHLPDEPWDAIKAYRTRFENAWRSNDRQPLSALPRT
jgi:hypothetical protein